jgi:hypothetical protein
VRAVRKFAFGLTNTAHPLLVHIIPIRRCNIDCGYCNEYDKVSQPVPTEVMLERIDHLATLKSSVVAFSGGAIGPEGTTWATVGESATPFDGTPFFFGCSDIDAHIPEARVRESARVCTRMGADVTTRIYPGMGHLVNDDEISHAQAILTTLR